MGGDPNRCAFLSSVGVSGGTPGPFCFARADSTSVNAFTIDVRFWLTIAPSFYRAKDTQVHIFLWLSFLVFYFLFNFHVLIYDSGGYYLEIQLLSRASIVMVLSHLENAL